MVGSCEQGEKRCGYSFKLDLWQKCVHEGMRGRERRSEIQKARDIEIMQRHTKLPDAWLRATIKSLPRPIVLQCRSPFARFAHLPQICPSFQQRQQS